MTAIVTATTIAKFIVIMIKNQVLSMIILIHIFTNIIIILSQPNYQNQITTLIIWCQDYKRKIDDSIPSLRMIIINRIHRKKSYVTGTKMLLFNSMLNPKIKDIYTNSAPTQYLSNDNNSKSSNEKVPGLVSRYNDDMSTDSNDNMNMIIPAPKCFQPLCIQRGHPKDEMSTTENSSAAISSYYQQRYWSNHRRNRNKDQRWSSTFSERIIAIDVDIRKRRWSCYDRGKYGIAEISKYDSCILI